MEEIPADNTVNSGNVFDADQDLLFLLAQQEGDTDETEETNSPPPCVCHNMFLGNCPTNISLTIDLVKKVASSGLPNRDGVQCPVGNLNIPEWEQVLGHYCDKEDVIAGNEFGWELGTTEDGPVPVSTFRNHSSANEHSESVDEYIEKELKRGTLCGPIPEDSRLDY